MDEIKLKVFNIEDRLTVSGILLKNGYTVRQGSEPVQGKKSNAYYVYAKLDERNLETK